LHIDVTASTGDDPTVQRVGPNEFILNAGPDTNNLDVEISAPNDIKPGFFEFDFTLQPVSVGE
jgi:hypothetical protein